jgi:polynucleotide 5'-kinase involved in rRNA processing
MESEEQISQKVLDASKKFPIVPFDFERDSKKAMNACSFAVIASSKSGKTTFVKYLLKKHFNEDIKLFMTQSPQSDIYNSIRKETAFAPAYIPDMIKTCYTINKSTKNHYKFCIVVDDVYGVKNDRQMGKLLALYRNSGMSGIVVGQDFTMLNALGRANVNNVILGWTNTDNRISENIKLFLRTYFPKTLSEDEKILLYRILTANHTFLWIDNLNGTIKRFRLSESQLVD